MNAQLKPITARAIVKPIYGRWDLVRTRDEAAWIAANRELIRAWYNDLAAVASPLELAEPFDEFAKNQFAYERDFFEQLRADAKLDDCYRQSEDE